MPVGGYAAAPHEVLEEGLTHALRAVELAPEEARCYAILSLVRLWRSEFDAAEVSIRKATRINPSDPDPIAMLGYVLALRRKPREGSRFLKPQSAATLSTPTGITATLA
jgi:adenylate cyclase